MFLLKYIFPFFANEVHFTDPKKFFQFLLSLDSVVLVLHTTSNIAYVPSNSIQLSWRPVANLINNLINDSRVVNYNRRVFKILVTGVKR